MNVILYSTHCPKCEVLSQKLKQKNIQFEENENVQKIVDAGFSYAPVLEVDGVYMDFKTAVNWVKEQ